MLNRVAWVVCFFLAAARAASAADVQATVDPAADFSRYGSFTFLQADPKEKGAITDKRVYDRLRYLIAQNLGKRGYRPAAPGKTGELGVYFSGYVVAKQRVFMTGRPEPYSYSWGSATPDGTETANYREGTLIVDLVDLSRGQLLWRARIQEALTSSYSEENWKKVGRSLDEAFGKLPAYKAAETKAPAR